MDQTRTAKEIARFSEKDAEKWLKMRKLWIGREMQHVQMDMMYNPAEIRATDPDIGMRQLAVYPGLVECGPGINPDSLLMSATHVHNARECWESKELQYINLRFVLSSTMDVNQTGAGAWTFGYASMMPSMAFVRGGTHQIAHAAHKILVRDGAKFFLGAEVEKQSSRMAKPKVYASPMAARSRPTRW